MAHETSLVCGGGLPILPAKMITPGNAMATMRSMPLTLSSRPHPASSHLGSRNSNPSAATKDPRARADTGATPMAGKISSLNPPPRPLPSARTRPSRTAHVAVTCRDGDGDGPRAAAASSSTAASTPPRRPAGLFRVDFRTLPGCELGISRYPDFAYDASGGAGTAEGEAAGGGLSVSFDVGNLYIPSLTAATTRFLGLPLPPFLRIDIVPELFQGLIDGETGQVDLDFRARFCFSVGSIYRAPPLMVQTRLTSEESEGSIRRGRGQRLDGEGLCRLVGVARVDPIGDALMDSFLGLPTECIARLNARIISILEDSGREEGAAE